MLMDNKIRIVGDHNQIQRGMELFKDIDQSKPEAKNRCIIQDIIDTHNFKGTVLYNGNIVWPYKMTVRAFNTLFNEYDMHYFSDFLYKFMHLNCGTIAHYNKQWWIQQYPDPVDVKNLLLNASIPSRKSDVKQIVDTVSQL